MRIARMVTIALATGATACAIAMAAPANAAHTDSGYYFGPYDSQAKCEQIRYNWDELGGSSRPCFDDQGWYFYGWD